MAVVISIALGGLSADFTLAAPPVVGSAGEADVPNPPGGVAGVLDSALKITWDSSDDPATSIIDDSSVTITAPSGLKFTNVSGTIGATGVTVVGGTTLSTHLSSDKKSIKFNIDAPAAAGSLTIGDTPDFLQLCPDDDAIMAMTEASGLALDVIVNGGFSNDNFSAGDIRLLNRPDIVTVDEVSSTSLLVTLKSEIGTVTVDAFYIGSSTSRSGGVAPSAVELDSNDGKKVTLTIPNSFTLDFDEKPSVWIMEAGTSGTTGLVHDSDRDDVDGLVANGSTKPKMVRKAETAAADNPTVTINNSVVGVNHEAVNESVNKAIATIVSTSGQPLKLKIVHTDDEKMNAPLDRAFVSVKVAGESAEVSREDDTDDDSDELNDDILCIKGASNDGNIDVIFNFGANGTSSFTSAGDGDGLLPLVNPAKAIEKGNEEKLKIMVSPDDFSDKVGSVEFTVDRKASEVVKSGDDKPVADADRKTIKLTFKDPLDPTSTEDKSDWLVTGSTSGALTTESVEVDNDTMTMVTIKTVELFQDLEKLTVSVREGTPTAVPGDKFFNPIFCATSTSALKTLVDNIDAPDLSKPTKSSLSWKPTEVGNQGVSDLANMVTVNIDADTSADLSRFVFQIFVVDNDDSLMINFNQTITDAFLGNATTAGAGFDESALKEISSGKFEGKINLTAGKLNDGDKIIMLCGVLGANDSIPASKSDWEDLGPLKTDILCVDNTKPVVNTAFRVANTNNKFMVEFSEEMQQASLRDRLPLVECGVDELTVSAVNIVGGSDNAEYSIFGELPADDGCVVKFDPVSGNMVQDVNGNTMDNNNDIGVDEAEILGEAPPETTTTTLPTGTETTTTTLVPGTSTTTTLGTGETTTTTTGTGVTTTTLGDGNEISVDPSTSRRTLRTQIATVSVTDANGDPVAGVDVTATPEGRRVQVSPSSATTGANGTAEFNYRFGFLSQGGVITFEADGLSTTLTQQ